MSPDFTPYLLATEQELRRVAQAQSKATTPLFEMMGYHMGWLDRDFGPAEAYHGKRLRPLLCLLACQAAGGEWHEALPAAAALELVHNFSLIHDDIEDNSPTRRGRATVWKLWGIAHGINVGDSMLVLAHLALGQLAEREVNASVTVKAMHILDTTCLALCQGQYMDIAGEGQLGVSEEWYMQMIGAKTSALIAASTQLGALIGHAGGAEELYHQFGWELGLAFQIVDDILGIWGDAAATGKPAGSDILSRKMTLPIIHALHASVEGPDLAAIYSQERLDEADVANAVAILDRAGAREYAEQRAAEHERSAAAALNATGACGHAPHHLRTLAASLTSRQR